MYGINDLILLAEQATLKWKFKGEAFSLALSEVDQVLVDESRDLIFVLDQTRHLPQRLIIINAHGKILSSFSPPHGGAFYYMTVDTKKEVLIVCVFTGKIDGWSDWYFSFDQQTNQLVRLLRAY